MQMEIKTVHHWPTLKTMLRVEDVLRGADEAISVAELKRRLQTQIMDQTLRLILFYLENKGDILISDRKIVWIRNDSPEFLKMIKNSQGIEL